jgi:hypothetical protein
MLWYLRAIIVSYLIVATQHAWSEVYIDERGKQEFSRKSPREIPGPQLSASLPICLPLTYGYQGICWPGFSRKDYGSIAGHQKR